MPRAVRPSQLHTTPSRAPPSPSHAPPGGIGAPGFSWLKLWTSLGLVSFCAIVWAALTAALIQLA